MIINFGNNIILDDTNYNDTISVQANTNQDIVSVTDQNFQLQLQLAMGNMINPIIASFNNEVNNQLFSTAEQAIDSAVIIAELLIEDNYINNI